MEKRKKSAKIWLCAAIILLIASMAGASLVQTAAGKVKVKDLRFETTLGIRMSALLFVPKGVSAENKAPAIVVSHGMLNNREMQDLNFVELSRRGFVVLAIDMFSHGNSETIDGFGALTQGVAEGVKLLSSINYVDTTRIGVTGHSFGGLNSSIAAMADAHSKTPVISAVLINACDATYKDAKTGEYINPYSDKHVGIIADQYDEFMLRDKDENGNVTPPRDFIKYGNAQSFLYFGTDPAGRELRSANTMYRETINGEEVIRVVYTPAITHPWSHFSKLSTIATIEFFDTTLGSPNPIPASNQVWQWKVFFNLLGLIGLAIFAVNFTILMLFTPSFASLRAEKVVTPRRISSKAGLLWFWGSLVASAVFSAVIYLPILRAAPGFTVSFNTFPQSATWGVSLWAAVSGLFTLLCLFLSYRFYGKKNGMSLAETGISISLKNLSKTFVLGVVVTAVTYAWVFLADYFFKTDFRIWVLAAKAFGPDKALIALFPYAELFMVYFIINSVAINSFNYNTVGSKNEKGLWINTAILAIFNFIGLAVLVFIQYRHLFSTGLVLYASDQAHLYIVWLFPVLVLLPASAVISRKIYKVTNNPYLPGIINALLVTLISVANTLTWV